MIGGRPAAAATLAPPASTRVIGTACCTRPRAAAARRPAPFSAGGLQRRGAVSFQPTWAHLGYFTAELAPTASFKTRDGGMQLNLIDLLEEDTEPRLCAGRNPATNSAPDVAANRSAKISTGSAGGGIDSVKPCTAPATTAFNDFARLEALRTYMLCAPAKHWRLPQTGPDASNGREGSISSGPGGKQALWLAPVHDLMASALRNRRTCSALSPLQGWPNAVELPAFTAGDQALEGTNACVSPALPVPKTGLGYGQGSGTHVIRPRPDRSQDPGRRAAPTLQRRPPRRTSVPGWSLAVISWPAQRLHHVH